MTTDAAGLPAEPPSRRVDPALTPANRSGPSTARTRQAVAARGEGQPPLSRRLRLVIADSNPIMRHGLRGVVEDGLPARVVAEARGGVEVLATVARTRPHAVVLDVRTPPCDRLDALPRLARLTRVIAISHNADPYLVTQALAGGAVAFLVHGEYSTRQLIRAVAYARQADIHLSSPTAAGAAHRTDRAALQPSPPAASATRDQLSPRERQVMDGVARGLTNSEIARSLGVSEKTVKNHINRIFAKLQVTTRGRAIVLWLNAGAAGRMP